MHFDIIALQRDVTGITRDEIREYFENGLQRPEGRTAACRLPEWHATFVAICIQPVWGPCPQNPQR